MERYLKKAREIVTKGGLFHITSTFPQKDFLHAIRINKDSPKSLEDHQILTWLRSNSEECLYTGKTLRDEPNLLPEDAKRLILLSRDITHLSVHPFLHLDRPLRIFTQRPVHALAYTEKRIRMIKIPYNWTFVDVLQYLQSRHVQSVCIEAGPSCTQQLYEMEYPMLSALFLSVYHGNVEEQLKGTPSIPLNILSEWETKASFSKENWEFLILTPPTAGTLRTHSDVLLSQ